MIRYLLMVLILSISYMNAGDKVFGPKEAMEFEKVKRYDITKNRRLDLLCSRT